MGPSWCICGSYRCRSSVLFIIYSTNQADFPLFFYYISFLWLTSSRRWLSYYLLLPVKARLWFTLAHASGQIGVPTNRLPLPLHLARPTRSTFFQTAAAYARYELNQLVYSLMLILILILILYSTSTTPNCSFFFLNPSAVPFIVWYLIFSHSSLNGAAWEHSLQT